MDPKQKKILIEFTCQVGPSELKNSIQIHIQSKNIEKKSAKMLQTASFSVWRTCVLRVFNVF